MQVKVESSCKAAVLLLDSADSKFKNAWHFESFGDSQHNRKAFLYLLHTLESVGYRQHQLFHRFLLEIYPQGCAAYLVLMDQLLIYFIVLRKIVQHSAAVAVRTTMKI